nr:methyltransferase [Bradyrhizobium frederickii]
MTAAHRIKPTSPRCRSARQPNPGRGSTYRRGYSVQTTGASSILKTCRRAMKADARLLLVERVVEPPNEGLNSKFSDLNMLVMLGALERTYDEYSALCRTAGFETRGTARAGANFQVIEAVPT